jgi:hypothetical protein
MSETCCENCRYWDEDGSSNPYRGNCVYWIDATQYDVSADYCCDFHEYRERTMSKTERIGALEENVRKLMDAVEENTKAIAEARSMRRDIAGNVEAIAKQLLALEDRLEAHEQVDDIPPDAHDSQEPAESGGDGDKAEGLVETVGLTIAKRLGVYSDKEGGLPILGLDSGKAARAAILAVADALDAAREGSAARWLREQV